MVCLSCFEIFDNDAKQYCINKPSCLEARQERRDYDLKSGH